MLVSLDVESTGVNPWKADRPFALSFTWEDNRTEYFSFYVNPFTRKVQCPNAVQRRYLTSVLSNPEVEKVGHNILFDVFMIEQSWRIPVLGTVHDTMFMAHACNSLEPTLKLKVLANKYLKIPADDEQMLQSAVNAGRRYGRKEGWALAEETKADYWVPAAVARTPEEEAACEEYCTLDTKRSLLLYRMYRDVMIKDTNAARTYEREQKLWWTTKRMSYHGVRTDLNIVKKELSWCAKREAELRARLEKVFGTFKAEIPDNRMREYLFDKLKLQHDPSKMTTKTKVPQVTRDVLESFEEIVPIVKAKIEFDKISKARGTYFQNYMDGAVPEGKYFILHAGFNQVGPKTGRFSCRNPNLQNVPKRARDGDIMQRVRAPFGPRPGCIWLHLDYQGIEARIFAELSSEPDMIRIFAANGDVYQELVDRIIAMTGLDLKTLLAFADSANKPGSGARQICKNNFLGWLYGEGFLKLMRAMHLPTEEIAKQVIVALREAYPKAQPFMRSMQERAKQQKYVVNRYGRRIPIDRPIRENGEWKEFWYKATNYLIQGTAADMMKTAMPKCETYLETPQGVSGKMLMTIHDELVFEFPVAQFGLNQVKALAKIMQDTAEEHFTKVRFPVDASLTRTHWSTPEKLDFKKGGVLCPI